MSTITSAKLVLLEDLNNCKAGDSVRVTGFWKTYNNSTDTGIIQYDKYEVKVDTANIEAISPVEGDIVQCIGEIAVMESDNIRINARIIKIVNTLDIELYEKVVRLRNEVMNT